MSMKLTASLLLLSVVSSAFAGNERELYTDGNWTLTDLDKKNPNASCIAWTTAEIGSTIYRLEFMHVKGQPGPTDIQIRIQGKPGASSYTMALKDNTILAFANAGEVVPKKQYLLWNIPQHTDNLISNLENRNTLRLKPADGSRDQRIEFDGDGFKRVRDKMSEKCLNNLPVYDQAFEDAFVLKRDPINPLGITPDQVKELRRVLNAAYALHLGIKNTQGDEVKLQARFQQLLNEKDSLNQRISNLQSSEIPSIIQSQQQNDALEASSRTQLQQVTVTIGQQQSALTAAQAQLNTARTVIAPYEAEHSQRANSAYSARSAATADGQRLQQIDSGIANANASINQLSNEAGQLQNQNARLENDLRYATQNRMRAEMDARNFRPREEMERRLRMDGGYQQSLRELQQQQNNLQIVENALNDARGRLLARQTELRVCQSRTSFVKFDSERIPAQENPRGPRYNPNPGQPGQDGDRPGRPDGGRPGPGGDRPDRPGRPDGGPQQPQQPSTPAPSQPSTPAPTQPSQPSVEPTPSTPTAPTTPTVDCTNEQNGVNQAQSVVSQLESQQRDARVRVDQVSRAIAQIQNRVEMEVRRINDDLNDRAMQAARQEQGIQNQIAVNARRVDIIANREIPNQQNIINSLSAERPSVQARYDQEVPNAGRLEGELRSFEQRVGWDAKVQAVQNAENLVSSRTNDLNQSLSAKSNLEAQIGRCQSERSRLASVLVDAQSRLAQSQQRLTEVIAALVPYDQEKARLEQQESDLKNQLATNAQDFESKLP